MVVNSYNSDHPGKRHKYRCFVCTQRELPRQEQGAPRSMQVFYRLSFLFLVFRYQPLFTPSICVIQRFKHITQLNAGQINASRRSFVTWHKNSTRFSASPCSSSASAGHWAHTRRSSQLRHSKSSLYRRSIAAGKNFSQPSWKLPCRRS